MYVETLKRISRALVDAPCTALIAGGAVRDIDNGKPYKDIDIFCLYDEGQDPEQLVYDFEFEEIRPHGNIEYQENWNGIHSVWDASYYYEPADREFDVQLVFQKKNEEEGADTPQLQVTSKFDLNICQAALEYDPAIDRFYIAKSDGYRRDKENGTITLTQHGLDLPVGPKRDKTRTRARRIGQKLNFRTDLVWDRLGIRAEDLPVVRPVDVQHLIQQQNALLQEMQRRRLVFQNNGPQNWWLDNFNGV